MQSLENSDKLITTREKYEYYNLISQNFKVGQICIDVYNIGNFKMINLVQISIRDICNLGSFAIRWSHLIVKRPTLKDWVYSIIFIKFMDNYIYAFTIFVG